MNKMGANEAMKLIKQLEPIRDQAGLNKNDVIAAYPNVDPDKDARITAFSKMVNVFNSVQLSLTFVSKHLLDLRWWKIMSRNIMPKSDLKKYAEEFMCFTKIGFVQFLFSTTESSFRLFLRSLNPTACDGGMGSFKSVYDCLLSKNLAQYKHENIELLDLIRSVRNTIHNNGVYFHRNNQDITVTWRGTPYEFKQSVPVGFVTWQFLIEVSDAVRLLMYNVVTDNKLRAITYEITDPFAS